MRLVLDLQGAQTVSRFRGIGRYSLSLAKGIARQGADHEIWICLNRAFSSTIGPIRREFAGLIPPERIVAFDSVGPLAALDGRNRWRQRASESLRHRFLEQLRPDVVYTLSMFEGWLDDAVCSVDDNASYLNVTTLYDLIPLLNPEVYLAGDRARDWYMEKLAWLKASDHLMAISDWSRREAIDALEYPASQITNISCAASEVFYPRRLDIAGQNILFSRFKIQRPFVLYNGALEWRKNVDRLLEAFAHLPSGLRRDFDLVIAGKSPVEEQRKLGRLASRLGIGDHLIMTSFVTDEELAGLYSTCTAFVFPSLHEGFGLPVLEAMSCGAAVIASSATSIPEAAGCQEALFEPTDSRAIAHKLERVLSDEDFRASLRAHARDHAQRFSWDASGQAALMALQELCGTARAAKPLSWSAFIDERQAHREQLLGEIASLPASSDQRSADDLAAVAVAIEHNEQEVASRLRRGALPEAVRWRIEGPFDSSYSFAQHNREIARALRALGQEVVLHSTEGPGDFEPDLEYLAQYPDVLDMWMRSKEAAHDSAHISTRLLYPPRVSDMSAPLNTLHLYAWEETAFPAEWAAAFNESLQGISCVSRHVRKTLVDAGVTVPMTVSACGTDHWDKVSSTPMTGLTPGRFRFLHVSSCFPRKGVDIMLKAFGIAFAGRSDVELIIKTFDNPHNLLEQWLDEARAETSAYPPVTAIKEELDDARLKGLYEACDALLAPSRAEGFGLPLAEAMLSGLPVITTAWGGPLDFCDEETAWLVDYEFVAARSHINLFASAWAEPRLDSLVETLREVASLPKAARQQRAAKGAARLREQFTWRSVANHLVDAARSWAMWPVLNGPDELRVGWVTTWGTKCGVATYSKHLTRAMRSDLTIFAPHEESLEERDDEHVVRCWEAGVDPFSRLGDEIETRDIDVVVIQFNYNFYQFAALEDLILRTIERGRKVVLELHSTTDQVGVPDKQLELLRRALRASHRVLVHSIDDMNRLKQLGVVSNVTLLPHGVLDVPSPPTFSPVSRRGQWLIASYGFFLPNKGLLELIDAIALLRKRGMNARLRMVNAEYPCAESVVLIGRARDRIRELGLERHVTLVTDFLPDQESLKHLAEADLVVFPYQTSGESASGAVRFGIASGRPVAVTPLPIFADVGPAVKQLPGTSVADLADGIDQCLKLISDDSAARRDWHAEKERWRDAHRYSALGWRLENMLFALNQEEVADELAASRVLDYRPQE